MPVAWDIIGHEPVVKALNEAVTGRHPAHAYLFTGARHLGKLTVARRFARALLCEVGTACGECGACRLAAAGNHPDLMELSREGPLTIDQVRTLKSDLSLKPHSARYRVGIVPDAERLGIPAQNALLKLLEEPPAATVLILTAASAERLLPTTVSRCRQIRFTRPSAAALSEALAGHGSQADAAIRASSRRPGLALGFLAEPDKLESQERWSEELRVVVRSNAPERLAIAKRLADEEALDDLLDHWLALHEQALGAEFGDEEGLSEAAVELAGAYAPAQIRHNAAQLLVTKGRLGYNPNVVLLMEQTLLTLGES